MRPTAVMLALVAGVSIGAGEGNRQAPTYSAASVVNSATGVAGPLAPNTIVSIYGTGLATNERVLSPSDIAAGVLPTALPGAGVRVTIAGVPAPLYYTGPTQVNFLVPSNLLPGKHVLRLMLDGRYGPAVEVEVAAAAPGFYTLEPGRLVATRADGSLIDKEHPIQGGEDVVFYGTGMGTTVPQPRFAELAPGAAPLANPRDFRVLVDGVTLPTSRIYYAGLTPGFAGLYQLNIQLPDTIGEDPEIRVVCGEYPSPAGLKLYGHPAPQAESTATSAR